MPTLLSLSDDLLHAVLVAGALDLRARFALARVCRRFESLLRAGETLHIDVESNAYPSFMASLGEVRADETADARAATLELGLSRSTIDRTSGRLRHAIEVFLLAHRRSVSRVSLRSWSFIRHAADVCALLPPLGFYAELVARASCGRVLSPCALTDLSLRQCTLSPGLAKCVPSAVRLRFWECPLADGADTAEIVVSELAGLAHLRSLVWMGESHAAPLELLAASRRPRGLRRVAISCGLVNPGEWDPLAEAQWAEGWAELGGTAGPEELIIGKEHEEELLTSTESSVALARALTDGSWTRLSVLQIPENMLSTIVQSFLGGLPAALFSSLPALRSLGSIDCSWTSPTWFFEPLAEAPPPPDSSMHRIRTLAIWLNSPAGQPNPEPHDDWDDGCALHAAATAIAAVFGRTLEVLHIRWYDEDEMPLIGVARASAARRHVSTIAPDPPLPR